MEKKKLTVDGNTAASRIAYLTNDMAIIYPITPSSPMAENVDTLGAKGEKNIFGELTPVTEMQSEAGAAGALHGALTAGSLATTFTSSQGLLLMIPNMYKIAGELLPTVIHVAARTVATHALSIFGDHSDVMAVRQTGFAMLASSSVQEAQDFAMIAQMTALKSNIPFVHFFDGFRTSHEINTIEELTREQVQTLFPFDDANRHKLAALTPSAPKQKGTAQSQDIFMQAREAVNPYYNAFPKHFDESLREFKKVTNRSYSAFEYYGAKDADTVAVIMGSGTETMISAVQALNQNGGKFGVVCVKLYRPFLPERFVSIIPATTKTLVVLDRTKESGAVYEPLASDVSAALIHEGKTHIKIVAGRYGLSSKEFDINHAVETLMNGYKATTNKPCKEHFTVGIDDDVTKLSLPYHDYKIANPDLFECKFYGLGSDGTVSANKNSIKIICDATGYYGQAYFVYDSKKSGSITTSHLRLSPKPIHAPYLTINPRFVAVHNKSFLTKFNFLDGIAPGGTLLLNAPYSDAELENELPASVKNTIANKKLKFFVIDAEKIANEVGLGRRINLIMQTAFFQLSNIIPTTKAIPLIKTYAQKTYASKGEKILESNMQAIDKSLSALRQVEIPQSWKTTTSGKSTKHESCGNQYFDEFIEPVLKLEGDNLKVSSFSANGTVQTGTSALEKRNVATFLPCWIKENCIECNMCSLVCPHACIRPYLYKSGTKDAKALDGKPAIGLAGYDFKIQVSPNDCTGCSNCAHVCPAKNKALEMVEPIKIYEKELKTHKIAENLSHVPNPLDKFTIKGSQFEKPLFEFSGACAGCGETPYIKLLTQLFGNELLIANATGCSSIYAGSAPTCPYAKTSIGTGPAWSNSLFEDNAEFGLGMKKAADKNRQKLNHLIDFALQNKQSITPKLAKLLSLWKSQDKKDEQTAIAIKNELNALIKQNPTNLLKDIYALNAAFFETSVWIIGGDGWAYDIGYGGLDHVVASNENINVLVLDTELYSNTGGQASKATPMGAVCKFAANGKETHKKDLGAMLGSYPNTYVAKISLGANMQATIKAFKEAYEHNGPSIIIAYAPCINHGSDLSRTPEIEKLAVTTGYFPIYRNNAGNLTVDPPMVTSEYSEFTKNESRYFTLKKVSEERFNLLTQKASEFAKQRYEKLVSLSKK